MSLLLNALKKAEEGDKATESTSEANEVSEVSEVSELNVSGQNQSPQDKEGDQGSQVVKSSPAVSESSGSVDFDAIEDPLSEKDASHDAGDVTAVKRDRVSAAKIFSAVRAGDEVVSSSSILKRSFVLVGSIAIVGVVGYYTVVSGLIPGVDKSLFSGLFEEEGISSPIVSRTVLDNLTASDLVLLPIPSVDIQSEVNYSDLLDSNPDSGGQQYLEKIAELTGYDIGKESQREREEANQLRADLSEIGLASGGGGISDESGEDVEVTTEVVEDLFYTAAKSREAKFEIDSRTASDHGFEIALSGDLLEEVDSSSSQVEKSAPVAQIEVKESEQGRERKSLLNQARIHYNKGHYASSESFFRQVLISEPTNKDALRGLAQIAIATKRYQSAVATYLDILSYYPNDPFAVSELANLQGVDENSFYEIEKTLKSFLKKTPEVDSRVYFSLGNLYAKRQDWIRAQSSYFEAFSRESDNPDFAYNLAVVLDYLNKPRVAVQYYESALSLSQGVLVGFDRGVVEARIRDLNQ